MPSPPLEKILALRRTGVDNFRGNSFSRAHRVYGGQSLGQAMIAAGQTVDGGLHPHSLHAHFIHPGDPRRPIDYRVERIRDSTAFATRHIRSNQDGRTVVLATVSFQRDEAGLEHQDLTSPPAAPPEDLPPFEDTIRAADLGDGVWLARLLSSIGVEFRFPEEYPRLAARRGESRPPRQRAWVRTRDRLADDRLVQASGFAYCSDLFLLSAALPPHARHLDSPGLQLASLDHSVWLHAQFRADQWHLYEQHGYWMGNGRGIGRGRLFDRAGRLVASTAQEGLLRFR